MHRILPGKKIVFLSLDIFMKNEKETSESEWKQKRIWN